MKRRIRDYSKRSLSLRDKFQVNLNIFKILSILLILIFLFFTPVAIKKLIKINKVECSSQYGVCESNILGSIQVSGSYKDTKKHVEQELSKNIQINDFLIQYKIPSVLKVEVNVKKPVFAIKNSEGIYYLVDKNGLVLNTASESSLPTLSVSSNYSIGEKISDQDKFALNLLEKIVFLYSINQAESDSKELKINMGNEIIARFPLQGDIDVLIGSLRLIFSRLNENENGIRMENNTTTVTNIREIDLRFKNVVVR